MLIFSCKCTGDTSANLELKPHTLRSGLDHVLHLDVWTPTSLHTIIEETFTSNLPVGGATCSVDPLEGKYIHCLCKRYRNNDDVLFSHDIISSDDFKTITRL